MVVSDSEAALVLVDQNDRIEFAGDPDLFDYHSPLASSSGRDTGSPRSGPDLNAVCVELAEHLGGRRLRLDSLPAEAAKLLEGGLTASGLTVTMAEHQVAMVLNLPARVDDFYEMIGKKERHELRRKSRRFEAQVGVPELSVHHGDGDAPDDAVDEFIRLHRLAAGAKGNFMDAEHERFFRRLARQEGWRTDVLRVGERVAACLFGWSDHDAYYLYNSSYDPDLGAASPGIVALTFLIESAIDEGIRTLDFLKGAEEYKARLGAVPRPLYALELDRR
jgi:CelD/BcsL family acetyltransferase involved in cellulose biosynthesis